MNKMLKIPGILLVLCLLALPFVGCMGGRAGFGEKQFILEVSAPRYVTKPSVAVQGEVTDRRATVKVNDTEVLLRESGQRAGSFSTGVELKEGDNTITVTATLGKWLKTRVVTVTYTLPLLLEITSPQDGTTVTEGIVSISGTVSDPEATVTTIAYALPSLVMVDNVEVEVAEDGTFAADVELTEGENMIAVSAKVGVAKLGGQAKTKRVTVTYSPVKEE